MRTCLNHPDVPATRRCEVCAQRFCHGCLEEYEPVGPVCAECEAVLEREDRERLLERLPALREEVRRTIPAPKRWWGWETFFWVPVALPSFAALLYLFKLFQFHQAMAILSQEPLLPAQTLARLTTVSAALERHYQEHNAYPETLEGLKPPLIPGPDAVKDLYSPEGEPLPYRLEEGHYRLCSRGPDRADNDGAPLDRFSGAGDMCVGD